MKNLQFSGIEHNTQMFLELSCPCHVLDHHTKTPPRISNKTYVNYTKSAKLNINYACQFGFYLMYIFSIQYLAKLLISKALLERTEVKRTTFLRFLNCCSSYWIISLSWAFGAIILIFNNIPLLIFETAYEHGRVKLSDFGIFGIPEIQFPPVASEKVALLLRQFLKLGLTRDKLSPLTSQNEGQRRFGKSTHPFERY